MITNHDKDRVLGDFWKEMKRRKEAGRQRLRMTILGVIPALALLWYAIQPLGLDLWHQLAFFAGLIWLLIIVEGPAYYLADEIDLLEEKLVKRFKLLEGKNEPEEG